MRRIVVLFSAVLTSVGFASAQTFPRSEAVVQQLSVLILTETVDHAVVTMGMPFHLKIHAVFAQNVNHLDNLNLPALEDFDLTSTERHFKPLLSGSSFDETLTLVPKHEGNIAIGPVSIDAINSRTELASKFSSTDQILVHVLPRLPQVSRLAGSKLAQYGAIVAITLSVAVLTYQIGGMLFTWCTDALRGKRTMSTELAAAPRRAFGPAPTPLQRYRAAVERLRRDASQANAEELRSALRDAVGATEEETLSDIIDRLPQAQHGVIDRALRAAERAAFIETADRLSAIEEGLPIFQAALHRLES